MEPTRSSRAGSRNSDAYSPEIADSLRFEEIQSLMLESPPVNGSSFTALLGLPPPQAVELLHSPAVSSYRETLDIPPGCSPTFPSNAALVDRASRLSVFAAAAGAGAESPEVSNSGEVSPEMMKVEPADSGGNGQRTAGKRKEAEKSKVRGSAKKSRSAEELTGGDDKLPYVHVRARRGQATDSHSLAERARREKINARMKLLQELVPGCNKISGTALVLDEIINHVQSLQRQVEFLSMRLAAVNPRVDFGLDNILSTECARLTVGSGLWLDGMINGGKQPQQNYHQPQQDWLIEHQHQRQQQQQQPQQVWDTQHNHAFVSHPNITTASGIFNYESSVPNPVPLPNQLKTEM